MKRRQKWLIGVVIGLIVITAVTWKMTEGPPFQFLRGAKLMDMDTPPNPFNPMANTRSPGQAYRRYRIAQPFAKVRDEAARELTKAGFRDVTSSMNVPSTTVIVFRIGPKNGPQVWINRHKEADTDVSIITPVFPSDYVRYCFFSFFGKRDP